MNNDIGTQNLHGQKAENFDSLFERISALIEQSRLRVVTVANIAEVYTKYHIGRYIVEDEQKGEHRAEYGKRILTRLSERLTERFGKGWGLENLRLIRKFYLTYSSKIPDSVWGVAGKIPNTVLENASQQSSNVWYANRSDDTDNRHLPSPAFTLSWSHYLILIRIENPDARSFYEIECTQQQWSVRQLSRQVGSSLYERLALSRDKEEVMRLAREGQTIEKSADIIKNPLTLEFLGLKPEAAYTESKLENAIIGKMQQFLLELGKGFLFEARQKRFTFDERNFYVDLVFYNRLLQCYVLIDLKTGDLTHQDLGQMQMYVNYYDRFVKQDFEKPTIGILLCESNVFSLKNLVLARSLISWQKDIHISQMWLHSSVS